MLKFFWMIIHFLVLLSWSPLQGQVNQASGIFLPPSLSIEPAPTWVKEIFFPSLSPVLREKEENIYYLLIDKQVDIDQEIEYTHLVKQLLTSAAVHKESTIELEFDPSYESIVLHRLFVYREGEGIDKSSSAHMETIQQEQDLENHQYNGQKTWVIFLDDIQAGDIVEYSYSRVGRNPVFKGIYKEEFALQTYAPIEKGSYRLIAGPERHLYFKAINTSLQPIHSRLAGGKQEWRWEIAQVDSYQSSELQPSWSINFPLLQMSEFAHWKQVAEWGNELFKLAEFDSPLIKKLVKRWQKKSSEPAEQVLLALRFVQNDIRYLGFEWGSSSHTPNDPSLVLKRRYGDCKDKTLLLKAFLSLMGISSKPVFVSSALKGHIGEWHPTTAVFDHVILQIDLEGHPLWVDPTLAHQGGDLQQSGCSFYQKGLVLDLQTTDLSDAPADSQKSQILVTTTIEFSLTQPASLLTTQVVYKGADANSIRSAFQQYGLKKVEQIFDDSFAKLYGEIKKLDSLEYEDHLLKNEFILKTHYIIEDMWKMDVEQQTKTAVLVPKYVVRSLDFNIHPQQKSSLSLDYPCHVIKDIFLLSLKSPFVKNQQQAQQLLTEEQIGYLKKPSLTIFGPDS